MKMIDDGLAEHSIAGWGDGWRPIESAPKDGEDILAWGPTLACLVVAWDDCVATSQGGDFPWLTLDGPSYFKDAFTHWMPLPKAPQIS